MKSINKCIAIYLANICNQSYTILETTSKSYKMIDYKFIASDNTQILFENRAKK